jgi:hypothetical protein
MLSRDNPEDYQLEIKDTDTMGKGLFTKIKINKGSVICPYVYDESDVMTTRQWREKYGYGQDAHLYTYRNMRKHIVISVKDNRNVVSYINERKESPNVFLKSYKLYANEDIEAGEQLFLKYYYTTRFTSSTHK